MTSSCMLRLQTPTRAYRRLLEALAMFAKTTAATATTTIATTAPG